MSSPVSGPETTPGLLSVVVPIGDVNVWLDEAVGSALASENVDLELIAVFNNGADVPEGWRFLADPRVRVIHDPKPLGTGGAGQRGIDAARGEFFVRLDADDRMRPDRLAKQFAWFVAHPETVLVSSQVDWIDGESRRIGSFDLPSQADVREKLLSLNVAPHSSWMARMSAVHRAGGYDLAMDQMDDYDLLLRLATLGPIAILPETLTDYRIHPGQMSRAVRPTGHYISTIAARRRALGAVLGVSSWRVLRARMWWELQQWLMFFGRKLRR